MLIQLITQHPEAIGQIVARTPQWVWGLLGGLVALGLYNSRTRAMAPQRVWIMPGVMTALALYGVTAAFAGAALAVALAAWGLGALVTGVLIGRRAASARDRFDAASAQVVVAGSWLTLALALSIFLLKYGVGVELSLDPSAARSVGFALAIGGVYGALSGLTVARGRSLWALASGQTRAAASHSVAQAA